MRIRLDKQTQDTVVSKMKCKDKENGLVQREREPYEGSISSLSQDSELQSHPLLEFQALHFMIRSIESPTYLQMKHVCVHDLI